MIKLKPTTIFTQFPPIGNSSKIADFGIQKKAMIPNVTEAVHHMGPELPNSNKKDNTWLYILAGTIIIIGGICYINYKKQKDEEEMQSRTKRNINRNT